MPLTLHQVTRWNNWSIGLGSGLWLSLLSFRVLVQHASPDVTLLLLCASLVIMPLVLRLVLLSDVGALPSKYTYAVIVAQPVAAICASAAFLPLPKLFNVLCAGIWLFFTAWLAVLGLFLASKQYKEIDALCRAAALIYVPIGALWLLLSRARISPLGFGPDITLFTAAHFHYIPLVALTMTGFVGASLRTQASTLHWKLYHLVAIGMLVLPLLVALGITLTQLAGIMFVETCASILLALNVLCLSFLLLFVILPHVTSPLARWGLLISGSAVFVSMTAAMAYAVGNATGVWTITYAQMLALSWVG